MTETTTDPNSLRCVFTCQVDVGEALSQGGDGGGEGVNRLVCDAPTLAQV